LNREFERADAIKVDLMAKDVAIDDINRIWRADGVHIFDGEGRNNNPDYKYASYAGPSQATMTDEEVVKLLAERQECRYNRDFDRADRIRDDLLEAGVKIDDKNRLWRADRKSFRNENRNEHNEEDLFREAEVYHGDTGSGFR
jgi:hypothetical protein